MKKLKFLSVFTLASMAIISCSSDDDSSSDSASIEGLWKIHEIKLNNVPFPLEDCDDAQTVEFNATDAIYTYYTGTDCTTVDDIDSTTYVINGSSITITDSDGDSETGTIEELTSSTLRLKVASGILVAETTFKR